MISPPRLESESAILARVSSWPNHRRWEELTDSVLRRVTASEGVDFTTALLYDRLRKSPRHAPFIQKLQARLTDGASPAPRKTTLVIVPGALYVERPDLGGDGRVVRATAEAAGWRTVLIPLASRGAAAHNARLILSWLAEHQSENLVLVSLSKGGADLRRAMEAPEAVELSQRVLVWINVGGPLNGTKLVDWVLASRWRRALLQGQYWLQRRDFRFVTEMAHSPASFHLPPQLRLINLIGFPLYRHLSTPFSRFCHRRLSAFGPSDGTTLLSDLHTWPGEVYPVWGGDHYFRPEAKAQKLMRALLDYLATEICGHTAHHFTDSSRTVFPGVV